MPDGYLSMDPNAGKNDPPPDGGYLSTDPHAGSPEPYRQPNRVSGIATIGEMISDTGDDVIKGVAKGVGNTVFGLGKAVHDYTPIGRISDAILPGAFEQRPEELIPQNTAQRVGYTGEQMAEFLLPTGAAGKVGMAAEVAKATGLTGAQGGSKGEMGASAVLSAVPAGAMTSKAAQWIGSKAEPLVRAAVKPTVTAMQRVAGASVEGLDAKAHQMVRFIIDNRVTTAEKARTIVDQAEKELQRLLTLKNAPTDAPQRALRYLEAIEKQAAKQGLPAQDVGIIRNAAAEVLQSGLGEDVVKMVPKPHPTLVGPNGQPLTVMVPETTRALRTDVMADEALTRARANSKWDSRKGWGEQKGAQMEASKAVERAERDAVKAAVPEARPILQKQGQAIQTAKVLDRAEFRASNRDAVSLPAHVVAAGEIATGRFPVMAFAANWLRNNQLKAGIWADDLEKAIQRNNVPKVTEIMKKLGVAGASQATRQTAYGK
jgi:hypothetical protein